MDLLSLANRPRVGGRRRQGFFRQEFSCSTNCVTPSRWLVGYCWQLFSRAQASASPAAFQNSRLHFVDGSTAASGGRGPRLRRRVVGGVAVVAATARAWFPSCWRCLHSSLRSSPTTTRRCRRSAVIQQLSSSRNVAVAGGLLTLTTWGTGTWSMDRRGQRSIRHPISRPAGPTTSG